MTGGILGDGGREFDGRVLVGYTSCAGWSSLVARRAHNPKVVSSNLTPATKFSCSINCLEATAPVASFSHIRSFSLNTPGHVAFMRGLAPYRS
jgi:hypothetical protein